MKKVSKSKLSAVYAKAIFESAVEQNQVKKVYEDVNKLHESMTSDDIKNLSSPLISSSIKKEIIKDICKKFKICDTVCRSLEVIADNDRLADLIYIFDAFNEVYYKNNDIVLVKVQTVKNLSSTQDELLKKNLKSFLNKEVVINYMLKPDIIGGLVMNFGSYQIDDSIKGKLKRLESVMKGGN